MSDKEPTLFPWTHSIHITKEIKIKNLVANW